MREKLTLEQFNEIKSRLLKEETVVNELMNKAFRSGEKDENKLLRQFTPDLLAIQNELLSYDLSDIPFEAWKGISLLGLYETLDLSLTKANIDFNIIGSMYFFNGINLKNCQIRNLEMASSNLYVREYFDESVVSEYNGLFLSSSFDFDFELKYIGRSIEIDDLALLSAEQLLELEKENILYHLKTGFDPNSSTNLVYNILSRMGLKKTVDIYNRNSEYLNELFIIINILNERFGRITESEINSITLILETDNIEQLMEKVDSYLYEYLSSIPNEIKFNFSDRFKQKFPQVFPTSKDIPEDVLYRYNTYSMTIKDFINYCESFKDFDITNHLASYHLKLINDVSEKGFLKKMVTKYPILFDSNKCPLDIENDYAFSFAFREAVDDAKKSGKNVNYEDLFFETLFHRLYKNSLEFKKIPYLNVYENASYCPEWLKSTGYYLSVVKELTDISIIELMISETAFTDDTLWGFLFDFGVEHIIMFQKEMGTLSLRHLNILMNSYGNLDESYKEKAKNYEEFLDKLSKLVNKCRKSGAYESQWELIDELPQRFRAMYPKIFISNDAPETLKSEYYSNRLDFNSLKLHPEWLPFLEDKNFSELFHGNIPFIVPYAEDDEKSSFDYQELNISLLTFLKDINKSEKFTEYILEYGNWIKYLKIEMEYGDGFDLESIENRLMAAVYGRINNEIKKAWVRNDSLIYDDSMPLKFKNKYPDMFLSADAPEELKKYFYSGFLDLSEIALHPDWIPYLKNIKLDRLINVFKSINIAVANNVFLTTIDKIYIDRFGMEEFLKFISPYHPLATGICSCVINTQDDSKEGIESEIVEYIYEHLIIKEKKEYSEDFPDYFKTKYPDIFLSKDAPLDLKQKFYSRRLNYEDLRLNPNYLEYIKNIDFSLVFPNVAINNNPLLSLAKEDAYKIVIIFGEYIYKDSSVINMLKNIQTIDEQLISDIKNKIVKCIAMGQIKYREDAPLFVKQALPHMFLDENAPPELKKYYYQDEEQQREISFESLKKHPEWQPLLKDKSILPFIFNKSNPSYNETIMEFILDIGGIKYFKKLINQHPVEVDKMFELGSEKMDLLKKWYLKTGKKFVPKVTVMTTMPFEDADKFLANAKSWSKLMNSGNYSKTKEGIDALLKLAYTFGIFEGNSQAEKKLLAFITALPDKLNSTDRYTIFRMEKNILSSIFKPTLAANFMLIGLNEYKNLREVMAEEGFKFKDNEPVLPLIYSLKNGNDYRLAINEQQYPKTSRAVRDFMEANHLKCMVTPVRAHQLFGGFNLKCDLDFREFLIKNIDEILTNPDYTTYIAAIQKQFYEIKTINSNRMLTLALAVNYVQQNKFNSVQVGNEQLSNISSIAGYTQEDFEILQQIYNYGKMRTFSSIPRIESTKGEYNYEILRLTDAFAVAAGTLSDCCQELGDCAEVDMEHSMTSEHGRLFLVKDEDGNIVAQSWVWRNQNVLCFDNIEIPDKAFTRATREKKLTTEDFAKIIYDIYVNAAKELIAKDEEMYKELFENGKISEEQYNGLRLTKITVGLGYNDIKAVITKNAKRDEEPPKMPPKYEPPVPLERELYLSDSRTQYILANDEGHIDLQDTNTLPLYYDDYFEYNKDNLNMQVVHTLQRLELVSTERDTYDQKTIIEDSKDVASHLAYNYDIDVDNLRLIITPNFAIVYEETDGEIRILDLLRNNKIEFSDGIRDVTLGVNIQIKLALLQLAKKGKQIIISSIEEDIEDVYKEVNKLNDSFDEERGISHGTKK